MFIKGSGKEFQGKKLENEKGEYGGSASSKQTLGAKGNQTNWNSKWQGTKLEKSARG